MVIQPSHSQKHDADPTTDSESTQPSVSTFMTTSTVKKYDANDPRQKRITDGITSFVVGTLQSLSVVDSDDFRHMIHTIDPRAIVPSRKHLSSKLLLEKSNEISESLINALGQVPCVSLTIDIWSNRQLRSYIGITAHFILNWKLHTALLTCKRFHGRHTADNIVAQYEEVINNFNITDKVSNIITDNASNMVKAFSLPGFCQSDAKYDSGSDLDSEPDDDDEMGDQGDADSETVESSEELFIYLPQRDGCFAHTLQLVVKDGMKEIGSLRSLVSKVSALVSHIRKSTHATDLLMDQRRVQAANATRWNSEVKMIRSVLQIPQDKLDQLEVDKQHKLSLYDRNCLQDLCDILVPFEEVTDITQGDKIVTCSLVVPSIRGLRVQLDNMQSRFNNKLVSGLKHSLEKRLTVFEDKQRYKLAAALDPRFKLAWCKEGEVKEQQAALIKEAIALTSLSNKSADGESVTLASSQQQPPKKQSKLFSFMTAGTLPRSTSCDKQSTASQEVASYLADPTLPEDADPLKFWEQNKLSMPLLSKLALNYLVVPATSAPVERVFSVAGRIFKPDRCQLNDKTFHRLVFIKYNKNLKF